MYTGGQAVVAVGVGEDWERKFTNTTGLKWWQYLVYHRVSFTKFILSKFAILDRLM